MPTDRLESLVQRALTYQRSGKNSRALIIYKGLIRRGYQTARVRTNLGAALYETGHEQAGIESFEAALSLDPSYEDAWNNLCIDAVSRDDWGHVQRNVNSITAVDPHNQQALHAKAKALMASGSFPEALEILAELLVAYPDDLELRESTARCFLATADYDSALGHLLYILSLKPGDAFASIELSDLAARTGDVDSSMAILQSAHAINPEDIRIIQRIAREHQLLGRMHEALQMYEKALRVDPESAVVQAKKAYCHSEIGEIETFFAIYKALAAKNRLTPEMLLSAIFVCSIQGEGHLAELRRYSELYWTFFERDGIDFVLPPSDVPKPQLSPDVAPAVVAQASGRKKKIGVVTGGLGTHVESCFLGSFLLNYCKDVLEVEVISSRWLNDSISEVLAQSVDRCHSISDLSVQAAREVIRRQDYDVILETTGFTSGSAIHVLADRCAPVQCHWIGYHASTYMPTMDYFIGDPVLIPVEHADRFSEQIVRLGRAWLAATPFTAIPEAQAPADGSVILGSFSQIAKLTPKTLQLWASLLKAAPTCRLMLKDKFTNDPQTVDKIISFFASRGVDRSRLDFVPRSNDWFQHMAMYNLIDISLDTTPWSSATTAFDALSMGVPMISIKGGTTSGLMSSSVLHHCGKTQWIAADESEYLEKNLTLIDRIVELRRERRDLQGQILTSQLFDGPGIARAIEGFVLSV